MTRWVVRFGYDGTGFGGWARQPSERTVEGLIQDGVRRFDLAPSLAVARLEVASRTDRGVSARANALALSSDLSAPALLRRLNAISPDIFFTAAAEAPTGFRLRAAQRRIYRYFDPGGAARPRTWARASALFRGAVDVRSFGRGVPVLGPVWRIVDRVAVMERASGRIIEVRAPSFVWGMVRKIVAALREVDRGHLSLGRLERAVSGRDRLMLPLAEPEGLILWAVEYPRMKWSTDWAGPNRYQVAFAARLRGGLWQRSRVADLLFER